MGKWSPEEGLRQGVASMVVAAAGLVAVGVVCDILFGDAVLRTSRGWWAIPAFSGFLVCWLLNWVGQQAAGMAAWPLRFAAAALTIGIQIVVIIAVPLTHGRGPKGVSEAVLLLLPGLISVAVVDYLWRETK